MIERTENPATGEEIVIVKGVVDQIFIRELDTPDRFQNTHRAGIRIGDDWVNNISLKTKEGYDPQVRINNGSRSDPEWVNLEEGDDVRIVVDENEWNGKTYLNSGLSRIKLVKKGTGATDRSAPSGQAQSKPSFSKKDFSGVQTGHAINVAINVVGVCSADDIVEAAKKAHDITNSLKEEYKEKNPGMSDYDLGAMVGQSVLSASNYVEDVADIPEIARQTLDSVVPAVSEYVKGEVKEKPKAAKKAAKKVAKRAQKKEEPSLEDVDDNIPF